MDAANTKQLKMTPDEYQKYTVAEQELNETLAKRFPPKTLKPDCPKSNCVTQRMVQFSLPNYTPKLHLHIAQMYPTNPHFAKYYDRIAPSVASFLLETIEIYLNN